MTWIVSLALQFSPYANPPLSHSHSTQTERAPCRCRSSRSTPRRPRRSPAGCCSASGCCCWCLGWLVSAGALWVDWLVCAGEQLAAQVSRPSCCCRQLRQLRWRAPAHFQQLRWTTQQHRAAASESSEEVSGVGSVLLDHLLEICCILVKHWAKNIVFFCSV